MAETPLRVELFTHYYPPEIGAASRRMRSLVRRWRHRGVDVHVVTPLPHYPHGRLLDGRRHRDVLRRETGAWGERITRVPFLPTERGGAAKLLDQLLGSAASIGPALAGGRPDVVVATVPGVPSMVPALAAGRRWRAPVVLDMRDSWPDVALEAGMLRGRFGDVVARLVTAAQRRADALVTVPPGFADVLRVRGVDPARIHHIPNGAELDAVPLLPPAGQRGGPLRVLYLGTHGVSQGLDTCITALARLGAESVDARFIGEGTERARLRALAENLGAPVRFEDPVSGADLWEAYRWADTCLVPLRNWPSFRDAVPSKLYEIMACGRHVTASLEGEAERVIREAGGGCVVAPADPDALADALRVLVTDRSQCDVGPGPRVWVTENRSDARMADDFLDVLLGLTHRAA